MTPKNLDETIRVHVNISKKVSKHKVYDQPMQTLKGARQFILRTAYITGAGTKIALIETTNDWKVIQQLWTSPDENSIQKTIKSLERKAKCKLYYRLLISTDGEYL